MAVKRCKFCGVKLVEVVISGETVLQCPVCGWTEAETNTITTEGETI